MFASRSLRLRGQAWGALLCVLASLLVLGPRAAAGAPPPCATPRQAAEAWLSNLPPNGDDPARAAACFAWREAGVPATRAETQARRLKEVFDQRGWYVPTGDLPDTAEVAADRPDGGDIALHPDVDGLYLRRQQGRWLITGSLLGEIDALHEETFSFDVMAQVDRLPAWARTTALGVAVWQMAGVFLALLVALTLRLIVNRLVAAQTARLLARLRYTSDRETLRAAISPVGTLAMAATLWWALPLLRFSVRTNQVGNVALRVLASAATVLLVYRAVDLVSNVFERHARSTATRFDDQIVPLVRKTTKVFVAVVGVIFVLQNLDVDVGSLLAGVSLGGLAFTLAAKDTVANLFGSISIFADQPFEVGDWVIIEGKEGVVEEVGMRSTRIRTFYDSIVTLPNSKVADAAIDNYGRRRYRRQTFDVGVTYDTTPEQIAAFVEGIRAILKANPKVRQDYYEVHFRRFGASALEVFVYYFLAVDSWSEELKQHHNVLLEIVRLARRLEVRFAFPTQTLHLESVVVAEPRVAPRVPPRDELTSAIVAMGPGGAHSLPDTPLFAGGFFPEAGDAEAGDGDG